MDAGLLAFVALKGGILILFFVMWRQAARAADEARREAETAATRDGGADPVGLGRDVG